MIQLIQILAQGVTDDSGLPISGGSVLFYRAGTTTLQSVYEDYAESEPHSNPATLDDGGRLIAYSDQKLKLVISDSDGVHVRTMDYVGFDSTDIATAVSELVPGDGLIAASDNTWSVRVDDSTIEIDSDTLQVKDGGIVEAKIGAGAVVEAKLGTGAVVEAKIGTGAVTAVKLATDAVETAKIKNDNVTADKILDNIDLSGDYVRAGGKNIVGSNTNAAKGLTIVRGRIASDASTVSGEGFSCVHTGTGQYTVTFSSAFGDVPSVLATLDSGSGQKLYPLYANEAVGSVEIDWRETATNALTDAQFSFVCIGQRA